MNHTLIHNLAMAEKRLHKAQQILCRFKSKFDEGHPFLPELDGETLVALRDAQSEAKANRDAHLDLAVKTAREAPTDWLKAHRHDPDPLLRRIVRLALKSTELKIPVPPLAYDRLEARGIDMVAICLEALRKIDVDGA